MATSLADVIENQQTRIADSDIDAEELDEQKISKKLQNKRYSSDTFDRKWLAIWAICIVWLWLAGVFYILIYNNEKYCLSDTVLTVLLGTTTLNVLGLSFIVLRGHFQSAKENQAS